MQYLCVLERQISAFKENENIPEEYSCDWKDISPEIKIVDASPEKYYMIFKEFFS